MPDDSLQLYPLWPVLRADMLFALVYPQALLPHYISLGQLKNYIGSGNGGATVTISDTSPTLPQPGDLWWSSSLGQLLIYYDDGTSFQWVVCNHGAGASGLVTSTKTVNYAATTNGLHYNNAGAAGTITGTLPAATPGGFYGFAVLSPQYHTALAVGADTIFLGATQSAPGGFVRSDTPGSFLLLECHVGGKWLASSAVGAWAIDA